MNGMENIESADGFTTAISGMLIVFTSLALISIFIAVLPRILEVVHKVLPEDDHPEFKKATPASRASNDQTLLEVAAAAVAVHRSRGGTR